VLLGHRLMSAGSVAPWLSCIRADPAEDLAIAVQSSVDVEQV